MGWRIGGIDDDTGGTRVRRELALESLRAGRPSHEGGWATRAAQWPLREGASPWLTGISASSLGDALQDHPPWTGSADRLS